MAKRRSVVRTVSAPSPTIRIQTASPVVSAARRVARRAGPATRRAAARVGGAVASEKHTITALAAAAAFGLAKRSGVNIPTVGGLSPEATVGVAAWAWGRWGRNQTAAHAATGLLSIAIHAWASGGGVAGVAGDDVLGYEDDDL